MKDPPPCVAEMIPYSRSFTCLHLFIYEAEAMVYAPKMSSNFPFSILQKNGPFRILGTGQNLPENHPVNPLFFGPKKVNPLHFVAPQKKYCPPPQSEFVKKSLPPPIFILEKSLCPPNSNSLNNGISTIFLRKRQKMRGLKIFLNKNA